MAKRLTTEDHLATLRQLRTASSTPGAIAQLESLLRSPNLHGTVARGAAALAAQWDAKSLALLLADVALSLAPPDKSKRDPGAEGKQEILRTLIAWEADLPDLYRQAARWIQKTPVFGGFVDNAAECRGLAAIGIARTASDDALSVLVDLLTDPESITRQNAAIAFGMWRGPEAAPVLRLKARLGDENADVLGEIFLSLLRGDPRGQLSFIASYLHDAEPRIVEVAAVAIAQSRHPAALELLFETFTRMQRNPIRTSLLMAIALLRTDDSLAWLLKNLESSPPPQAVEILDALAIYKGDTRALERIKPIADKRRPTAAAFREIFST
jgi:HEAT repeat protein